MAYFDELAPYWDEVPANQARAAATFRAIVSQLIPGKQMRCLEYGSGTGLLSAHFQPLVKEIVLADTADGMLEAAQRRIRAHGIKNMRVKQLDLLQHNPFSSSFHLIYTLMAMHHIPDTAGILTCFQQALKAGGYLCIADLVEEDGRFHAHHDNYQGHNGFNLVQLQAQVEEAGLEVRTVFEYHKMLREYDNGDQVLYPLFLLIARKPDG